jgi:hypothetical protein
MASPKFPRNSVAGPVKPPASVRPEMRQLNQCTQGGHVCPSENYHPKTTIATVTASPTISIKPSGWSTPSCPCSRQHHLSGFGLLPEVPPRFGLSWSCRLDCPYLKRSLHETVQQSICSLLWFGLLLLVRSEKLPDLFEYGLLCWLYESSTSNHDPCRCMIVVFDIRRRSVIEQNLDCLIVTGAGGLH